MEEDTNELIVKSVFPQQYPQRSIEVFDHIHLDPKKQPDARIGVTGRAALTRQAQLVPDVSKDDDYIMHNEETKSELAIPMLDNDKVIGVLDVEGKELNAFDELDRDSLSLLVDLAVVALRNAEQAEQLTRSNAVGLMGAWGAEIVHDINREVGFIRREIFWLRQQLEMRVDLIESLTAIDKRAGHLALPEIPERLPGQEAVISPASADIDSAILSVIEIHRRDYDSITFRFEPGCQEVRVAMHERFILAIFRNLLRNAEHALSQDDSNEKWVHISTRVDGSMALIEVKNSGPKVRDNILPYLFKRLIPHEDGRKGRGLLLVGFLVEQHGGRSEVIPDEESGAFFRFWLPLAVPSEKGVFQTS
jgi:signal transduction histidine kinase